MSEENQAKPMSKLIELTVKDKMRYYSDTEKGKQYEVTATMTLAGQDVELKNVPIPPELAVQIIALVERAAVSQITESMNQAQAALSQRLSATIEHPALITSQEQVDA